MENIIAISLPPVGYEADIHKIVACTHDYYSALKGAINDMACVVQRRDNIIIAQGRLIGHLDHTLSGDGSVVIERYAPRGEIHAAMVKFLGDEAAQLKRQARECGEEEAQFLQSHLEDEDLEEIFREVSTKVDNPENMQDAGSRAVDGKSAEWMPLPMTALPKIGVVMANRRFENAPVKVFPAHQGIVPT